MFAFISEQDRLAQPNLNYVWDTNTMSWVKETQPGGSGGGAGDASASNQTSGAQKTQIVDGSGNVIGSTSNALDVNVKSPLGQTTMSASIPIVVASDQSLILVVAI